MVDKAMPTFTFQIFCRSGVLVRGASPDFLLLVYRAKLAKEAAAAMLPEFTLRGQICAPNGERVSSADLRAAVNALNDAVVFDLLRKRNSAYFSQFSAGRGAVAFSQAGVVAPPDSLTGETLPQNMTTSKGAL